MSESFMAHAMQIMNANQYTPTQAQVDKMLALQEKGMDYTHNERIHFSPALISALSVFGFLIIVLVGLFVFCVFYAPQYASQIISLAIGLATGGLGGYGYGSTRGKKKNGDDE
jgi:hypothetical protein